MAYKDVNNREAIEAAIKEYDECGSDEFFSRYGFGPATSYFLLYNGREYPSKAILGVAHKYQFPEKGALRSGDFGGGKKTVQPIMEKLGFKMKVVTNS